MDAPKRKTQKSDALTWLQVHPMTLFFVHLHVSRGRLGLLKYLVNLIEVEMTKQGRQHPALRRPLLPRRVEKPLQQAQNLVIVDSPRDLIQHYVMSHRIKAGAKVEIEHVGLALQHRFRDALDGVMRGLLGPIVIGGWKSASKMDSRISFNAPWTTRLRIAGIEC
jgi:hypothetical protein